MSYENVKNHRKLVKERIVYVMGEKCCLCGLKDNCVDIYDFHHINPIEKDFSIAQNTCYSWESLIPEFYKGVLLCANCHRKVHANFGNYSFVSSVIPERIEEVSCLLNDLKSHKVKYCKDCGAVVCNKAERCPQCANLLNRKVERPNREELKYLIRTKPFTQIGTLYGVTDNAIRRWCANYNLPSKRKEINFYSDEEWIKI